MSFSSSGPPSNVRVFVHWPQQPTVFAGEDIRCVVTFKHAASSPTDLPSADPDYLVPPSSRHGNQLPHRPRNHPQLHRSLLSPGSARPSHLRNHPSHSSSHSRRNFSTEHSSPPPFSQLNGNDAASLSINRSANPPLHRHRTASAASSATVTDDGSQASHGRFEFPHSRSSSLGRHHRSISVVSIGSNGQTGLGSMANQHSRRLHSRAASLQITPTVRSLAPAAMQPRKASHPPLTSHFTPRSVSSNRNWSGSQAGAWTEPSSPWISDSSDPNFSRFRFPSIQSPDPDSLDIRDMISPGGVISPGSLTVDRGSLANHIPESSVLSPGERPMAAAARIISAASNFGGTPRSSAELYSLSNNSTETLASEYPMQQHPSRGQVRSSHLRPRAECLMMGYAQVHGFFLLDGSLVNLAPFEKVKKMAVVDVHGGGVIGVNSLNKRDGGLLGGFGWSSFTTSIGELLGGGDLSTIKEMRGMANSRSIPLLSTPQSVLFVDLQLSPGESKSFEYVFKMPGDLPPSHRGKAIKIFYSLVIGTQRPGGAKEQQISSVEVPFRVLSGVGDSGELLEHDLMSPFVILRDLASVQTLENEPLGINLRNGWQAKSMAKKCSDMAAPSKGVGVDGLHGFVTYVQELLSTRQSGYGRPALLSPTAHSGPGSRRQSVFYEETCSAREAIDLAILRSNMVGESQQSPNRYEIARNGQRVGVVMLARPAYRLGETLNLAVDFTEAEVPCYALHFELETGERVNPLLALRSEASLLRVTRRVHAFASETVMFSRRAVFSAVIPLTATPDFVTSHISLEWRVRIEFVVPSGSGDAAAQPQTQPYGSGQDESTAAGRARSPAPLLERLSRDDKGGTVLVAAERVLCESFEVVVPLRVYGAVGLGLDRVERDEAKEEEGLVI